MATESLREGSEVNPWELGEIVSAHWPLALCTSNWDAQLAPVSSKGGTNKHKEREKKGSDFFILHKACKSWSTTLFVYSKYLNTQCKGPCLQCPSGNDSAC